MENIKSVFKKYLTTDYNLDFTLDFVLDFLKDPNINKYLKSRNLTELYNRMISLSDVQDDRLKEEGSNYFLPITVLTVILEKFYGINVLNSLRYIKSGMYAYRKDLTTLNIPSNITCINFGAFKNSSIERITIPGNVKDIDSSAFIDCEDLVEVDIMEGVERIYEGAFEGCINLQKISFPKSIRRLGESLFQNNSVYTLNISYNGIEEDFIKIFTRNRDNIEFIYDFGGRILVTFSNGETVNFEEVLNNLFTFHW